MEDDCDAEEDTRVDAEEEGEGEGEKEGVNEEFVDDNDEVRRNEEVVGKEDECALAELDEEGLENDGESIELEKSCEIEVGVADAGTFENVPIVAKEVQESL